MSKLKIHAVLALIHTQTHTRTLPPWIPLTSSHPHMVTVERKLLHQCKQKQEKPCLALLLLIKSNWYDSSVLIFSLVLTFMYSHWHEQTLTRPDPLLHDSFKPNWYIYTVDIYIYICSFINKNEIKCNTLLDFRRAEWSQNSGFDKHIQVLSKSAWFKCSLSIFYFSGIRFAAEQYVWGDLTFSVFPCVFPAPAALIGRKKSITSSRQHHFLSHWSPCLLATGGRALQSPVIISHHKQEEEKSICRLH